jgi:alkanesulfonate monooxygenase SsuD/methylene tetrahydromethanopterin reductase-like flavin-dependent oxidoreductase (luciferase family)
MRLGLSLVTESKMSLGRLAPRAHLAERLGFEILWFEEGELDPAPLATAAGVAAQTETARLGVRVAAGPHPLAPAEDVAVLDVASNGRAVLAVEGADKGLLAETVEVLRHAFTSRPFRHQGERWTIPANLPANEDVERRIIVSPDPVQTSLPIWVGGSAGAAVAESHGLPALAEVELGDTTDADAERGFDPGTRPVVLGLPSTVDPDQLTARLLALRDGAGVDTAILRPAAGTDDEQFAALAEAVARFVRPRIQVDRLPTGLDGFWRATLPQSA